MGALQGLASKILANRKRRAKPAAKAGFHKARKVRSDKGKKHRVRHHVARAKKATHGVQVGNSLGKRAGSK